MQTEKYIRSLLEQLNGNRLPSGLFPVTRKLSEIVRLIKIWDLSRQEPPGTLYLVLSDKFYAGAVMEQNTELYAYMLPVHRRKGLLRTALKDTILPHLLQGSPILRVTLNRAALSEKMFLAARNLATATGFEILREEQGQCRFIMDGTTFQKRIYIAGENVLLNKTEQATVRDFLAKAALYTEIAQCQLEYRNGRSSLSEDLLETGRQLTALGNRIS